MFVFLCIPKEHLLRKLKCTALVPTHKSNLTLQRPRTSFLCRPGSGLQTSCKKQGDGKNRGGGSFNSCVWTKISFITCLLGSSNFFKFLTNAHLSFFLNNHFLFGTEARKCSHKQCNKGTSQFEFGCSQGNEEITFWTMRKWGSVKRCSIVLSTYISRGALIQWKFWKDTPDERDCVPSKPALFTVDLWWCLEAGYGLTVCVLSHCLHFLICFQWGPKSVFKQALFLNAWL